MNNINKDLELLKNASPLEATKILQNMELYDAKSSQAIIDEVYEQFANKDDMMQEIVQPVFMAIMDGVLEGTSIGRKLRKKGLTASRFIKECESFNYVENEQDLTIIDPNAYTETKNAREYNKEFGDTNRAKYKRSEIEDKNKMNAYKQKKINENGDNKNLKDEYTGKYDITPYRNNPDGRRNDPTNDHQAEPDHIIPLKQIHEQFKGNYGLSEDDIKIIANADSNLALTSGRINGRKGGDSNREFINKQKQLKQKGKNHCELTDETAENMLQMEAEAKKTNDTNANKMVMNNLRGKGTVDKDTREKAYKAQEEKNGKKLTEQEKRAIDQKLSGNKQKKIVGTALGNAANQAKDYAVGNIILYVVKPVYFELKDIMKNGMEEGVSASSIIDALKIRFNRLKKYLIENFEKFAGDNLLEFVKGMISSLIEGFISLFTGIFKQVLKVVKEGIKVFTQSAKILFGEGAQNRTPAEKGDAMIKLIGGSVIALSGIGIEALINRIGIGEPWSVILSTMLSGIASVLFMYLLDKIDLFSLRAERRHNRIIEIFNERIRDIKEATEQCNIVAIETLKNQREQFDTIAENIDKGLKSNDIELINSELYKMAKFMKADLPYSNTDEFCDYMDTEDPILL